MPKKQTIPLLLCLLLLTGCTGRSHAKKQDFLALRARWLATEQTELHASLRADYGDRVYDYVLSYSGGPEKGSITVEAPELIAGVGVELGDAGVSLRWNGAELDTGAILGELSPVQAFPLLLRCWQSAPVLECREETRCGVSCLAVDFDLTEAGGAELRRCRTWFHAESGRPAAAELSVNGRTVLSVTFTESNA